MGPLGSFQGAFAANLGYDAGGGMFKVNQDRMGLANRVTGNETPDQLIALNEQDKQLLFKGIQHKTNYEISNALQDASQRRRQKDREQRQRLFNMGAIFA